MPTLYSTATEYVANALTIERGTVGDIVSVGVYHSTDPEAVPAIDDFTSATLVDGTADPADDLSEAGVIDVLSLIGPDDGDVELAAGTYYRWVLITTAQESIIRPGGVLEIL